MRIIEITLNWLVHGDDPYEKLFSVEIDSSKNIHILKTAIQKQIHGCESASDIKLFKVDLDLFGSEGRDENVVYICSQPDVANIGEEMTGGLAGLEKKIHHYFDTQPNTGHLNIIVQLATDKVGCNKIIQRTGSLTTGIAEIQLQDKEIWIHYGDADAVYFRQKELRDVRYVHDLKRLIKDQMQYSLKDFSGEVIRISKGDNILKSSTPIDDLFNTEDEALEVTIVENDYGSEGKGEESKNALETVGALRASDIEPNHVEKAFQIGYKGTTLDTFYLRLKQFHDEWYNQVTPYAPYLTIIQSSGSGKTRLVGELRTKGIYVLYICKRHKNSSGYPASTPYVQQIIEKIRDNKFGLLLSEAIKLIKSSGWNGKQFWDMQIKIEYEKARTQFWKNVIESVELLSQQNDLKDLFIENEAEIPVVCCIDEAHELHHLLMKRLTLFDGGDKFGISSGMDSLMSSSAQTERLAISFLRKLKTLALPGCINALAGLAKSGNLYDPQRALYLGIPLWGSLTRAGIDLIDVLHLASQKIRNFSKKKKDHLANLACMSCSFALEICPRIAEVEMLIASHMATAIGVSDRRELLCMYPSDPILASGALKGIINVGFEDCLDTLLEQFSRGVVGAGERGELVSRILFLEAYIRTVEKSQKSPITYLEKVPLLLFLKTLCNGIDHKLYDLLVKVKLDQAEIGFNHWTSLLASNKLYVKEGGQKYLSESLIREAYHRHTAFKMPISFPVIDHVIPFKHPDGYGIISIQNKNAKTTKYQDVDVPVLVNPTTAFGNNNFNGIILGIFINTGTSNQRIIIKEVVNKTRNKPAVPYNAIYIDHIKSFKCKKQISERLLKVLIASPWPLDTQWSMINEDKLLDRKQAIKSFLPLVFKQERPLADNWQL